MLHHAHIRETPQLLKPSDYDRINKDMAFTVQGSGQEESCDRLVELLKEYDEKTCGNWREEIDTLLVFAGLFSAVVAGFVVASFAWLQPNNSDISLHVLLQISQQNQAIGPGLAQNATMRTLSASNSPINHVTARHVNALWFASLSLSLTAALVGILCKQWVRLYPLTNNMDALKAFSIRQMRHEGLASYRIPATIASISIFLEISVVLFFIGMVYFTWNLDRMVAFPVLIIATLVGIFLIATTVTPLILYIYVTLRRSFDPMPTQCPWKSPQSWLLIKAWNVVLQAIGAIVGYSIFRRKSDLLSRQEFFPPPLVLWLSSWSSFDHSWASQNNQCDATILAGPGAFPYLSSGLPWALKKIETPEIPLLAYHILTKAIQSHDKQSLPIFYLTSAGSSALSHHAYAVSESDVGNAHLVKAVIKAKGVDLLIQNVLEDDRHVRINQTVPTCILAAFDEWATCSIHSSSCSGEFTQATLLYLTGEKSHVGVEHCARLIGAHLGHKAKGNSYAPNPSHKYAIPAAVHIVFSAHMTAVVEHMHTWTDCGHFPLLDDILLTLVEQLLHHDVIHINTHDEFLVSGRAFLLDGNIPRLPIKSLAYFPDILRYFMARFRSYRPGATGDFDVSKYLGEILRLLNDYVCKHPDICASDILVAFQKLVGGLGDLGEAITAQRDDLGASTIIHLRSLIESLHAHQERSVGEVPAGLKKFVSEMERWPRSEDVVDGPPPSDSLHATTRTGFLGHPDTLREAVHPDDSHPSTLSHTEEAPNIQSKSELSPETGIVGSFDRHQGEQLNPSHRSLSPIDEVDSGSELGGSQGAKRTDKSEEDTVATAASSDERTKLSDDILQEAVRPDGSHPSALFRIEEAPNIRSDSDLSPETGIVGSFDQRQGEQLNPTHHPLSPIDEVDPETPGVGTEPSGLGSELGGLQGAKHTDKSEEDTAATATSSNERTKLSDIESNV